MLLWIKRLALLILLLIAFLVGIVFTSENNTPFALTILGFQLPQLSIGLWLSLSLFSGAIIGLLINYLSSLINRYSQVNKDKKIRRLEKELAALRVSGLKG